MENSKTVDRNPALNANGLNTLIKSTDFFLSNFLHDTQFRFKDINSLKVKGWNKIGHAYSNHRRAGVA